MRRSAWTTAVAVLAALSLGVAACGSSGDKKSGSGNGTSTPAASTGEPKQGGKLTALWSGDVDFIDCGRTYYQAGYQICSATQRALYSYKPTDGTTMVPDLAEAAPEVSADGKTVTVKIRTGVKFSPPVSRAVTSKDVKYAVERGFWSNVANGYAGAYFGDIEGAKTDVKPGTKLDKGITTPDDQTVVFHLSKPSGGVLAGGALGMMLTAPVPEEYASKFDQKNPTTYGENQVATGPYMVANDASGKAVGYEAGKRIHLVRNPSWDKSTDFKPAYLDEIDNLEGNDDTTVASRRILTGQAMINGDWTPPPAVLKDASSKYKDQLLIIPGSTVRYVALNTKIKPFDNINLRKAVVAAFDRSAMRLARGGPLIGDIASHWMVPGIAGFDEAGGQKGTGVDFINTSGEPNLALATEYMKKAGYPSGKYTGTDPVLAVGSSEGTAPNVAEVTKQNLEKLGFKVTLRLVTTNTMYTKFCGSPAAKVAVCPNVAWGKDFADGQSMLDPVFNGENIVPQGNSNFAQLDVPAINAEMDKAKLLTDPAQRAQAWAAADKAITAQAPGVPWLWDKWPLIASANVKGAASLFNSDWDFAFTALK
jgi:peptide/nickel transport system substrate-binding protein